MGYPPIWTPAPGVTLYQADCAEVLPTLAGLDAVITDPPYGIRYDASHTKYLGGTDRDGQADWDIQPYDPAPILALDLPSVIWGAQCFASRMPDRPAWLIWIKTQRDGVNIRQTEAELAWCNAIQRTQIIRHLWIGAFRDSESGQQNIHPTQKPVRVMAWCMDAARVATGALVVDPYMGSASTILACIRTGRRAIGIERDAGALSGGMRQGGGRAAAAIPAGAHPARAGITCPALPWRVYQIVIQCACGWNSPAGWRDQMADKTKRAGRPTLHDYATAEVIRRATATELAASRGAAFRDGGAGVITITLSAAMIRRTNQMRQRYGVDPVAGTAVDCYALEG